MFAVNKILVPVEFSEKCVGAARYAKGLASHFGSQIVLLHVIQPFQLIGSPEIGIVPTLTELSAKQRADAEEELERFGTEALRDIPARRVVLEGDPARQIVDYAHAERVGLIVMPTHGYGPFRRFLLGSVVAKVLHDADCPIWTGVHLEEVPSPETISFGRIACAVDLGPSSERVLSWTHGMASAVGGRLSVIHVTPPFGIAVAEALEPERAGEFAQRARRDIEALLKKTGATAEVTIGNGPVPQAIHDFAVRVEADLLVIGRGAREGVVGRLRSHAYAIIRESPCPVASV